MCWVVLLNDYGQRAAEDVAQDVGVVLDIITGSHAFECRSHRRTDQGKLEETACE